MTVRFNDHEAELLREQARIEDRTMQDVLRVAFLEYLQRRSHTARVDEALRVLAPRNSDLLRRLGSA